MIKWMMMLFFFSASVWASEGAHHGAEGIPYKTIITQAINLLIFIGLMVYFLRKELAKHFAERKSAFHELVNRAEKARSEAEATRKEISDRLVRMENSAQGSMKQAEVESEEMRKKMITEAKALSDRIQVEAQKSAQVEIDRARAELRTEILRMSTEQAEKTLREKVGDTEKTRLQNEFVEKIQVVR